MKNAMLIALAIAMVSSLFTWLVLYRVGWASATQNGHDPWALFFYGIGGAAVPIGLATVIAGVWKLVSRASHFLTIWFVVLFFSTAFFGYTSYTAAKYEKTSR